jgi:hypothetical protein
MNKTLTELLTELVEVKAAENAAKAKRVALEQSIADLVPTELGSQTTQRIDGFKVVVKLPINYRIDSTIWDEVKTQIPVAKRPVKTKLDVDVTGLKWLADNEPDIYQVAAKAITSSAGKPAVSVTVE